MKCVECGAEARYKKTQLCAKCYNRKRYKRYRKKLLGDLDRYESEKRRKRKYMKKLRRSSSDFAEKHREYCRKWYAENRDEQRSKQAEYYRKNADRFRLRRKMRELGLTALQIKMVETKCRNRCSVCGKSSRECVLAIHHYDGQGWGKDTKNNSIDNLTLLCPSCHNSVEARRRRIENIISEELSSSLPFPH